MQILNDPYSPNLPPPPKGEYLIVNNDLKCSLLGVGGCLLSYLIIATFLISCTDNTIEETSSKPTLTIATAANAQFAIQEIATIFENKFKTKVHLVTGSSGKLTAQIIQGAPYDLLISANTKYPERLFQDGYANSPPAIYANGKLVLWTMLPNIPLDTQLLILKSPQVKKISIANPKNAPYGEEAIRALQHYGIYENVVSKLVYGESIAQTTQFISTKNCEIGITAKSIVSFPKMVEQGIWEEIPDEAYHPIQQGVVITTYGIQHHKEMADRFFEFLFSKEAQLIFEAHGYGMVNAN